MVPMLIGLPRNNESFIKSIFLALILFLVLVRISKYLWHIYCVLDNDDSRSTTLQKAQIVAVDVEECNATYVKRTFGSRIITRNQLCGTSPPGSKVRIDACQVRNFSLFLPFSVFIFCLLFTHKNQQN